MFEAPLFITVPFMFLSVFALEACVKFIDSPTVIEIKPVQLPTIYE